MAKVAHLLCQIYKVLIRALFEIINGLENLVQRQDYLQNLLRTAFCKPLYMCMYLYYRSVDCDIAQNENTYCSHFCRNIVSLLNVEF